MYVKNIKIKNGFDFTYVNVGEKFKTEYLSVNFITPLDRENTYKYSMLPAMLTAGSCNYPDRKSICIRLEELYGSDINVRISKRGENLVIGIAVDFLSEKYADENFKLFEKVIYFLYDIIFNPLIENDSFPEKFFKTEKEERIERIKSQINNKSSYAVKMCAEFLCENELFGISVLGEIEEIEALTPQELYYSYLQMLKIADTQVIYVGNRCENDFADWLKKASEKLGGQGYENYFSKYLPVPKKIKQVDTPLEMKQGKLSLGYRFSELSVKDKAASEVFLHILSYSPCAKLFVNVREKLSLCYYCRTTADFLKGIMIISCGVSNENFDTAFNAIQQQISDIAAGEFSEFEFSSAIKNIISECMAVEDSVASEEAWYLSRKLFANNYSPADYISEISGVTRKRVMTLASEISLDTKLCIYATMDGAESEEDTDYDA